MRFPVSPEKENALLERMQRLGIREADLDEQFVRGSGKGGQKINKTSSAVYLKHLPTGIEVRCQETRFQAMNRFYARRLLCERLEERILGAASQKQQEIEKIRRQKRTRSRKQKKKMLEEKRHRGGLKKMRGPVAPNDS